MLGIHFRMGLVGSTIKQSSLKYAIIQSEVVPGVEAIAPHSKIFPICKASPESYPSLMGRAANIAGSLERPAIITSAPSSKAFI